VRTGNAEDTAQWLVLVLEVLILLLLLSWFKYKLKPRGNYMYHLLYQSVTFHFVLVCFM
jgi:hypothetical protein